MVSLDQVISSNDHSTDCRVLNMKLLSSIIT